MSDSNMTVPEGIIVGTAGHIDHGKTRLVHALTGIDTDRLAEEKRRGISIDLGFAHMQLPGGERISFIDVPGHERFIKNMLAGAAGIEAVLLIVAADESVKPQTREHFEICRLLGIENGLIVLTKIDLASPEQMAIAREDVQSLCAGSFLETAPIVPVSAATGQGLAELQRALAELVHRRVARERGGLLRLPIDRSFAMKGFGAVVTGTMWNGALHQSETVQIHPGGRHARVRGLQVHGKAVETAVAGQRTAVNLTGIDHSEIQRGCVLTRGDVLEASKLIDASVVWLEQAEIPSRREQFLLHFGTSEVPAFVKVLAGSDSRVSFARIWLREPLLALPGDRFVLRRPSTGRTAAGGTILDAFPPARLNRTKTRARLERLAHANPFERLQLLVEESRKGKPLPDLVRATGWPTEQIKTLVRQNRQLVFVEPAQRVVSKAWIDQTRARVLEWLRQFHAKHPGAPGAPVAQARLDLDPNLASAIFDGFTAVQIKGDVVALASHKPQVSAADQEALGKIERAFRQAGLQPAAPAEVLRSAGADILKARGLLEALIKSQKLVRVSEELIFHSDVLAQIRKSLAAHKGRKFSVPEFKEWTQVSRKYAIPLLEYLDRQHVTRREGDGRVVL